MNYLKTGKPKKRITVVKQPLTNLRMLFISLKEMKKQHFKSTFKSVRQ
jgi:hypothetical protein